MDIEKNIVNIQNELKKQGYVRKSIDYKELQGLHRNFGNNMDEKTFAQKVLQVSYASYMGIKNSIENSGRRVKVLKGSLTVLKEEEVKEIQNNLRQQGYVERKISYEELQSLHRIYGKDMSEKTFALEILELSYGNYNSVKNLNTRAIILKSLLGKTELTKEEIEEIQELVKEEQGYPRETIVLTQESVREIQKQLAKQGYARKIIDYFELQNLYQEYGKDMSEEVFALRILEVSYGNYQNAKNRNARIRILKSISRYIINEMQEELKQNGNIGKMIDYNELQNLHQNYGSNMDEEEFAKNVLLLSKREYISIKDKQKRSKILNVRMMQENLDFKPQEVREILKGMGYVNKLITCKELQELHREYGKEISEESFAKRVLDISDSTYYKILTGKAKRIRVLSYEEKFNEIDCDKIKAILQEKGFARKLITYERLQELHREYGKEMSEKQFAEEVLEIHRDNYYAAKNTGSKIVILSHRKETQFITDTYLKESRYYTKQEILDICDKTNISIDIFINRILSNHYKYSELYKELIEKGKVWIGKAKMSDEFVEGNFETINKLARIALKDVKKKFAINYNLNDEDLMQEAIMCVINTRADIEKNFSENYKMLKMSLYTSMRKYIWFKTIEKTKVKFKTLSLNSPIYRGKNGNEITLEKGIANTNNTENEALAKMKKEIKNTDRNAGSLAEKCIAELRKQIESGKSKEDALRNTSKKLNIGRQEMINAMQNHLITSGMVRIRPKKAKLVDDDGAR